MGTLDPNVEKMFAKRDIKGLAKILHDESDRSNNRIWAHAYLALKEIADEFPFSNSDMDDIVKAIAERAVCSVHRVMHMPYKGKEYCNEEIRKITQSILDNCETLHAGRLPEDPLDDEVIDIVVKICLHWEKYWEK